MSAGLAAGLALLLVLGGLTTPVVLLMATALAQVLLALAWFPALDIADSAAGRGVGALTGGRAVVAVAAVVADVAVLRSDETRPMAHVGAVLAVALLASVAVQLLRRDGRSGLTGALTATGSAVVVAGLGAAWLALDAARDGTGLLLVAAVAAAAAPAADLAGSALRLPRWAGGVAAAVVAAATGAVVAGWSDLDLPVALAAALGAAVAARLGALLAGRVPVPHPLLPAVLPALLVAPATYVLARVLHG